MTMLKTPTGRSGWTQLKDARGFKGSDENKKYKQDLVLPKEEGLKFVASVQQVVDKMYAAEVEKARLKGKALRFPTPIVAFKETPDGDITITFSRKESDGAPTVVDKDKQPFTGMINRDTTLAVAFSVRVWVIALGAGVTLKLEAVQVLGDAQTSAVDLFGDSPAPEKKPEPKKPLVDSIF